MIQLIQRARFTHVLALLAISLFVGSVQAAQFDGPPVDIGGVFHPGEPGQVAWRVIKPAHWNGTLVLDLDFAPGGYSEAQRTWFLERRFAIGGIQRTQNQTAYELKKYVADLLVVRQNLIDAGAPTPARTIAFGASRGSFVARVAIQSRPDIFDGAVVFAGGGGGVLASWISKADGVWALKTLVDPTAPLAINNLPDIVGGVYGPGYDQDVALGRLVTTARSTPQGMARLVLAAALEQAPAWPSGPVKPADDDYETQGNLIAASFSFGNPQFVQKQVEIMAGGPVTWNHGVNYEEVLNRSGDRARVEYWYDKAGLDLDADLRTLEQAPRYSADPAALHRLEQIGTYTGQTGGGPVIAIKTIGDPADSSSLEEAYIRTFEAAGNLKNLRTVFINRAGHSSQTLRERLTGFATLIERLDNGNWPDTGSAAMNARALNIGTGTSVTDAALGVSQFIEFQPVPALRTWDFTNWGTYFAKYVDSLDIKASGSLEATLGVFARGVQRQRLGQACLGLDIFQLQVVLHPRKWMNSATRADLLDKANRLETAAGCR